MTNKSTAVPIPLRGGLVGAGTQPGEADGSELHYLQMPSAMRTYEPPALPEPELLSAATPAVSLLESLYVLLTGYRIGALPQVIDLQMLDPSSRRLVEETLGEGEVSVQQQGSEPVSAQETRLAGVWRVRSESADGRVLRDVLEIADVPGIVRFGAFTDALDAIEVPAVLPDGIMNAPGVLAELNERAAAFNAGKVSSAHVINLTLLPQTEQDLAFLDEMLDIGPVTLLSRGYGNCRITSTRLRNVWWVRHFNSDDRLILDTLEITEVPEAALAAQEDIADSAERLAEILGAL
ncbi:MAG: hydrogenase expression/formation protein [Thiohalocapsa sp.]|nr:hydrogenase expression/formation protein [Thiohalocapsa sp.]MCF7989083.1 hydrogenase expression/formation protein [Thiohalocapsa sp.]